MEKAILALKYENADLLDMGERCLMAYALAKKMLGFYVVLIKLACKLCAR